MLYLEDYLEMIENLPIEMRDRFTEIREMDLQVQNAMDSLEERVKGFFKKCGSTPNLKQEWKDEQFGKVKEDYKSALEDADEKVQLANQIYDLLERHLRKLDQELSKFKMELEADNAGITEILEKRSLELDQQPRHVNNHRAEKRKYVSAFSNHINDKKTSTEKVLSSLAHEAAKETLAIHRTNSATSSPSAKMFDSPSSTSTRTPALSYNLGHVGAGSNAAIAQAASRAIGATLEVSMQHGRRTASLKASYEAVTKNADITKDLLLGRDGTAATTTPATEHVTKSSRKKGSSQQSQTQQLPAVAEPLPVEETPVDGAVGKDGSPADWMVDPNEPRYCVCNEVSYGEMVGCDNDDCPIEWFHYGCVGLTQAPKGKWYCPQCRDAMKRRGRK